jgi:TetR/AcrR family transcriptional repressor of nem operon
MPPRPDADPADEPLRDALQVFWERGYAATSIDTLIAEAGLNRAAIYRRYGSKQGFFAALLGYYRRTVSTRMLAPLYAADAGLDALRGFLRRLRLYGESDDGHRGCLMAMTASEVSVREQEVARVVGEFMTEVRGLFRAALARAVDAGRLRPDLALDDLADYLLGSLLGFMTLARAPVPRSTLAHHVDGVLRTLDALTAPPAR